MALSQEKKGTIAVSLTNFLDSGCIVASGVALAAWAIAFNFDNVWVSILGAVGANAFGAAVGALIGGFLADRFGRKFIYTYNLLVYATGVFLIMCAVNLPMLCAGIVISGLSVGAGVPSSWSYISEMSSSTSRAANIGISQFAWSCGPAVIFLIALLFSFIFPTFGPDGALLPAGTYGPFDGLFAMRLLFLILFVVALIAWNLQRKLEESKDWTEKQDAAAGKRDTFIQMMGRALTNSVNVKSIVFLVAVYLTWNIVAGTMGQFMPYMYAAAGNLDDTTISLLQAVMWILTAVGSLAIFSKFGDKIPHRILFAATAVMALAAWVVMVFFGMQLEAGTADSWGWLLWVFVALTAVALVQPVVQMLRRDPQETLTRGGYVMEPLIELKGVVKEFRSVPPVRPLDGVSLAVAPGRIVAVTGVSGKGKSTLLNVMGGLLRADEGSVLYRGTDLARASAAEIDAVHRRGIGFVFQSPYLFPALTARENMVMALRAAGQPIDGAAIETMLEEVGLTDRADHLPAELSVGQKRRLALARVLLADEPTNDLDADWSDEVFDRFRAFVAAGDRSVVVVTHDEAYARQADEVYVLEEGRLARREEVASC
mgnify:CR=1 FL=1